MPVEMTMAEIENQFDSEWVLIDEPQTDENLRVLRGRVLHHSPNRDEVYRAAIRLHPKRSAILYTGKMPENTAVVL